MTMTKDNLKEKETSGKWTILWWWVSGGGGGVDAKGSRCSHGSLCLPWLFSSPVSSSSVSFPPRHSKRYPLNTNTSDYQVLPPQDCTLLTFTKLFTNQNTYGTLPPNQKTHVLIFIVTGRYRTCDAKSPSHSYMNFTASSSRCPELCSQYRYRTVPVTFAHWKTRNLATYSKNQLK